MRGTGAPRSRYFSRITGAISGVRPRCATPQIQFASFRFPAERWSNLVRFGPVLAAALLFLVGACAQRHASYGANAQAPQEVLPDGGPPVINGLHDTWSPACSKECPDGLAPRPMALRARPDPSAPVVATTHAGEWLSMVGGVYRMRPVRGVLPQSMKLQFFDGRSIEFKAGDIVYLIDDRVFDDVPEQGLWFRGRRIDQRVPGFEQGDEISLIVDWQVPSDKQKTAAEAAGAGWWAYVRRDNGQRGYVLQTDLECWGISQDPPPYCEGGRMKIAHREPYASNHQLWFRR
jgi:hypothetical protein